MITILLFWAAFSAIVAWPAIVNLIKLSYCLDTNQGEFADEFGFKFLNWIRIWCIGSIFLLVVRILLEIWRVSNGEA